MPNRNQPNWPCANPEDLANFDPSTKVCVMNCGPSTTDPRSEAERRYLCDDCEVLTTMNQRESFEKANPPPANVWWSGERGRYIGIADNHLTTERYQGRYEGWLAAKEQRPLSPLERDAIPSFYVSRGNDLPPCTHRMARSDIPVWCQSGDDAWALMEIIRPIFIGSSLLDIHTLKQRIAGRLKQEGGTLNDAIDDIIGMTTDDAFRHGFGMLRVSEDGVEKIEPEEIRSQTQPSIHLKWSEHQPPNAECSYNHVTAETPFGRFLITWKGWKENECPTVDETPWGGWWNVFGSVDEAKQACADEYLKRLLAAHQPKVSVPEGYVLVPLDVLDHSELLDKAMDYHFDWNSYADRADISEAARAVAYAARDLATQQPLEQKEESSPEIPVNEESLVRRPVRGNLRVMGNFELLEDGEVQPYDMALVITFDNTEDIRTAIQSGVCEFGFMDQEQGQ